MTPSEETTPTWLPPYELWRHEVQPPSADPYNEDPYYPDPYARF